MADPSGEGTTALDEVQDDLVISPQRTDPLLVEPYDSALFDQSYSINGDEKKKERRASKRISRVFEDEISLPAKEEKKIPVEGDIDPDNPLALVKEEESGAHKLSTFYGVYLPVIMSIYNTMMYIRFTWFVGCLGYLMTCVIFTLGFAISFLTTMSMSAICANGLVKGGGVYFILSRVLGPTYGGAVGVLTWLMNTVSGNLSILGMWSPLVDKYNISVFGSDFADTFVFGSLILLAFTLLALVGNDFFEKVSLPLFLFSIFCVFVSVAGFIFSADGSLDGGYTKFSWQTFKDNFLPPATYPVDNDTGDTATPMYAFGVFYPCVTGILVGANMSGDLKTPDHSIPKGTFLALFSAVATYFAFITCAAWSVTRDTLLNNYFVIQQLAFSEELVVYAIVLTGFLAALSGIMGASRILQAIAKDDLVHPKFGYFAVGAGVNGTPRRAVFLTWLVTQLFLFITQINVLAPLITQFFLVVYGMVNLAAFLQRTAGVVNFRPRYRIFHWSLSLLGFIGCVVTMFIIDPLIAIGACGTFFVVTVAITWRGTEHINWGELSQAMLYHQTRKYLLKLDVSKHHVKYWRPEIMLLTKSRKESLPIIALGNALKKGGLYSVCSVLVGDFDTLSPISNQHFVTWSKLIHSSDIKAFPTINVGTTVLQGSQSLLLSAGLGAMRPNTVLLGWPHDLGDQETPKLNEFFGEQVKVLENLQDADKDIHGKLSISELGHLINDCVNCNKNVILTKSISNFDPSLKQRPKADRISIEVWIDVHMQFNIEKTADIRHTALFTLQMGYILSRYRTQYLSKVRVVSFKAGPEACEEHKNFLIELLDSVRVRGTVQVIDLLELKLEKPLHESDWLEKCNAIGRIIKGAGHAEQNYVRFIAIPSPNDVKNSSEDGSKEEAMTSYFKGIRELSSDDIPTLFCRGVQDVIAIQL